MTYHLIYVIIAIVRNTTPDQQHGGKIMANMSYCRFQNTRRDLQDCIDALDNYEELSMEEFKACKHMLEDIFDFFARCGIVDYKNMDELKDFINSIDHEED